MKKKLLMLSLALISCVCVAVGFSACGEETHTHDLTAYEAVAATCTEDGNIAYWYCSDCGKYFSDANGTTEIFLADTVVSALGHDYETNFSWTETDGVWTATATRTCANDSTDTETVNAVVTEKENSKTDATCTTAGSVTYIATATFSDNTSETEEKPVTIPATGHTYSDDWTTDGSAHWHAATCEHTTEVSDYAAHTFAADSNGDYVCSVCGYKVTTVVNSYGTLALGDNYVCLSNTDDYVLTLTYTATKEGYYTISIPEGCQAFVYVENSFGQEYKLGYTDETETNLIYTATLPAFENDTITVSYVGAISAASIGSTYVFDIYLACEEKTLDMGTESTPYSLTYDSTQNITVAAGAKCYFTVSAGGYDMMLYVSNSALKLYQIGDEGDTAITLTESDSTYCLYMYASYGSTYTFYYLNDSESEVSDTINFTSYTKANLVAGSNQLSLYAAMADNNGRISYKISVPGNTAYTITLGEGTDSNVAIRDGSVSSTTDVLGYNVDANSYILGNSRTSTSTKTIYIVYYGSAATFNVNIVFTEYEEVIDDDDANATYTALTLDTAVEGTIVTCTHYTVSSYKKIYFSYVAETAGTYTLTLDSDNSYFSSSSTYASSLSVIVGENTYTSSSTVFEITLAEGTNYIIVKFATTSWNYTITGKLSVPTSGGDSGEAGNTNTLSVGSNTVEADTDYTFTATIAGTYKFTISGDTDYASVWAGETDHSSSWSPSYLDVQSAGVTYFTVTLKADETVTIYLTGSNGVTLTIAATEESGESGNTYVLNVGTNNMSFTADEASDGHDYTLTVTESGTYTFSVESGADAYVYLDGFHRITGYSNTFDVELTAGTEYTITVGGWDGTVATSYTLTIAKNDASGDDDYTTSVPTTLSIGDNTITLSASDAWDYYTTSYEFEAGSYTITLTSVSGDTPYLSIYSSDYYTVSSSWFETTYSFEISEAMTINFIYTTWGGSAGTYTLTLSNGSSSGDDTSGDDYTTSVPTTLSIGDNTITLSASDAWDYYTTSYEFEAGSYTITLTSVSGDTPYLSIYSSDYYTVSSSWFETTYSFEISEAMTINFIYTTWGGSAGTYTLTLSNGSSSGDDTSGDDTSDDTSLSLTSAGLEIVFDGTTYNYDENFDNTYPVKITVTEAGKYEFKFTGTENLNITCGAWSAGYVDYYNGEYETDSKTFAEGDVITVYAYCAGTFTITLVSE